MTWDSEPFYSKSKLYIQQADKLAPEDRFFVFWHLLAYEFLIKACIAKKSKALLADPRQSQNILFAVGVEITKIPTQRQISELLEISKTLIPSFTEEEYKKSLAWIGFRNEEIHTGSDRLSEVAETGWLSDYYRITKNLLKYLEKDLGNYFGTDKVATIEKMIIDLDKELSAKVKKEISDAKSYYKKLSDQEKDTIKNVFKRPHKTKVCKCPSCTENYAVIVGELISVSEPELEDGDLYAVSKFLPSTLSCAMCRLKLDGYSEINAANLGAVFSVKEYVDPIEQFNIDIRDEFREMYPDEYRERYEEYMDE